MNIISSTPSPPSPQKNVLKVSARVEKNVPHYRGDNEFSILTGCTFTFKTVFPSVAGLAVAELAVAGLAVAGLAVAELVEASSIQVSGNRMRLFEIRYRA